MELSSLSSLFIPHSSSPPSHHTPIHPHSLYTHLCSCHIERFLQRLALGDVPVIHPHTLPRHRTLILHFCYLLLGTAGEISVIVVDVIPETPALQCEYKSETSVKLDRCFPASLCYYTCTFLLTTKLDLSHSGRSEGRVREGL